MSEFIVFQLSIKHFSILILLALSLTMDPIGGPSSSQHDLKQLLLAMRETLNEDCLIKIFEYLSVFDLINIYETDNAIFTDLIKDQVIGRQLWDFNDIMAKQMTFTITKIFEVFGPSMKQIKVKNIKKRFCFFRCSLIKFSHFNSR